MGIQPCSCARFFPTPILMKCWGLIIFGILILIGISAWKVLGKEGLADGHANAIIRGGKSWLLLGILLHFHPETTFWAGFLLN